MDTYGRITSITEQNITGGSTSTVASSTLTVTEPTPYNYQVNLSSSGATPGTYGSSSAIPLITVDTYGRITSISTASPADAGSLYCKALLSNTTTITTGVSFTFPIYTSSMNEIKNSAPGSTNFPWSFGPTNSASLSMVSDGRVQYTGLVQKAFLVTATVTSFLPNGWYMEIRKNGSNSGLQNNFSFGGASSGAINAALNVPITLNTNDYVSIFMGVPSNPGVGTIYISQLTLINLT